MIDFESLYADADDDESTTPMAVPPPTSSGQALAIPEYHPVVTELETLEATYKGKTFDLADKDQEAKAREGKRLLTRLRNLIEKRRLERNRQTNDVAKWIVGRIVEMENPLAGQLDRHDAAKQAEKEAKKKAEAEAAAAEKRAEAERVARHQQTLREIRALRNAGQRDSEDVIRESVKKLDMFVPTDMEEFETEATQEVKSVRAFLIVCLARLQDQRAREAQLQKEREELARQREEQRKADEQKRAEEQRQAAELKAERDRLAAERAAFEAEKAARVFDAKASTKRDDLRVDPIFFEEADAIPDRRPETPEDEQPYEVTFPLGEPFADEDQAHAANAIDDTTPHDTRAEFAYKTAEVLGLNPVETESYVSEALSRDSETEDEDEDPFERDIEADSLVNVFRNAEGPSYYNAVNDSNGAGDTAADEGPQVREATKEERSEFIRSLLLEVLQHQAIDELRNEVGPDATPETSDGLWLQELLAPWFAARDTAIEEATS